MTMFRRLLILLAGLTGCAGVAAAAAGAHANPDPALTTAATFLMIGAGASVAASALAARAGRWSFADAGGGLILLGTVLFSGALAARVLWNVVIFPMAAPTGGIMLMAGWLVLGLAAFERSGVSGPVGQKVA